MEIIVAVDENYGIGKDGDLLAPLKQADDAVLADTTNLDFTGSCDLLVRIIKEKAEIR